jgi:hypothetical protein
VPGRTVSYVKLSGACFVSPEQKPSPHGSLGPSYAVSAEMWA